MEAVEKRTFSEHEIKELAVEIQPLLNEITKMLDYYNMSGFLSITAWNDKSVTVNGTGLEGWSIERDAEGFMSIHYSYDKKLDIEKDMDGRLSEETQEAIKYANEQMKRRT